MTESVGYESTQYDVVVVGYGAAGAAAAIEAHDHGAKVLVIEKNSYGGGATYISSGSIATVANRESAIDHYHKLCQGRTPRSIFEAYVDGLEQIPAWIESNGGKLEYFDLPSYEFPVTYSGSAYPRVVGAQGVGRRIRVVSLESNQEKEIYGGGGDLWDFLSLNVETRAIPILFESTVVAIKRSAEGRYIDCEYTQTHMPGTRTVRTNALCLTAGGYAHDHDELRESIGSPVQSLAPLEVSNGNSIGLARQIGAHIWHRENIVATYGYNLPGEPIPALARLHTKRFVIVDQQGRRFVNESCLEYHTATPLLLQADPISGRQERIPCYIIFDDTGRRGGPIGYYPLVEWSDDNRDEVAKGWIKKAESIYQLAKAIRVPAETLARTIQSHNAIEVGNRDAFGRVATQEAAVDKAPFYAIPVHPVSFCTLGGPKRDSQSRIIGIDGRPLRGIYGAGELGSIWANLYPGAGMIGEALVFGRIAGKCAAIQSRHSA